MYEELIMRLLEDKSWIEQGTTETEHEIADHLQKAADAIEELTDKNVGKWVKISPAGIYECSQCGQNVMTSDIEAYKFCHGCGAQMIGGDEDV